MRSRWEHFARFVLVLFAVSAVAMAIVFVIHENNKKIEQKYTWKRIVVYNVDYHKSISTIEGQCILPDSSNWVRTSYVDISCLKDESGHFKTLDRIHLAPGVTVFAHELDYPDRVDGQGLKKTVTYHD